MNGLSRPWPQSVQFILIILLACLAIGRLWPSTVTPLSAPVPLISTGEASLKGQADDLAANWVAIQTGRPRTALKTLFSGGRGGHFSVIYEDSGGGRYQMVVRVNPAGNTFRWTMWPYRKSYS